jgi:hypothetical protein
MNDNGICEDLINTETGGFFIRLQNENLGLQMF